MCDDVIEVVEYKDFILGVQFNPEILQDNKIYDVISIEKDWYRIIDDSGEDYLYPPELFEIVES